MAPVATNLERASVGRSATVLKVSLFVESIVVLFVLFIVIGVEVIV